MTTESEAIFEKLSTLNQWELRRLTERGAQGLKTPDYLLFPRSKSPIVTEVKQLNANKEDKAHELQVEKARNGGVVLDRRTVRSRISKKLQSSTIGQLKAMQVGTQPTMVVIYNNIDANPNLISADDIMDAMYGAPVVLVSPPELGHATPLGTKHAGNRRVTERDNTTLSAVAVMKRTQFRDREPVLELCVYHNCYAKYPLDPATLIAPDVVHFRKSRGNTDWQKLMLVTQLSSSIGILESHRQCLEGLGLKRIRHTVAVDDTRSNRGMATKVQFMVQIH